MEIKNKSTIAFEYEEDCNTQYKDTQEDKLYVAVDEVRTQIKETITDLKDDLQECNCGFDECPECYRNGMVEYAVGILKRRFKELLTSNSKPEDKPQGT